MGLKCFQEVGLHLPVLNVKLLIEEFYLDSRKFNVGTGLTETCGLA